MSTSRPDDAARSNDAAADPDLTQELNTTTLTAKLVEVLDQYLADLKAGTAPSREQMLEAYPELGSHLDACLAGIDFIQGQPIETQGGQVLADFRIGREVGRGGMGAVYEAEQISLGRRVALKVLRFGAVSDLEALTRFQREAETVAKLHHTNIVPIFSVGSENGVNFYAMQFIDGSSLDQVRRRSKSSLNMKTVARWGLQAAEALSHAHERSVIHRDVKPSNLMLDGEERIWLTDFGLAKRLDDMTLSLTGALLGTPRYMSPEQATTDQSEIDHRTDIYSLGATLYELVTNKPVFDGDTHHTVIQKILEEEPIRPSVHRRDVPRDLETILMKCLAKEPHRRYQTAEALAEDLRAFANDRPIKARRANFVEMAGRWIRKNRQSAVRTASTIAATTVLVLVSMYGWSRYSQSRLAFLELDADTPLVAKVVDRRGVVDTVTLPTQNALEVAAGEVEVHVAGEKSLGQTYRMRLAAGQQVRYRPNVDMIPDAATIGVPRAHRLLAAEDGTDVVLMDNQGIQCYDGRKQAATWAVKLAEPRDAEFNGDASLTWNWGGHAPFVVGQLDDAVLVAEESPPLPAGVDVNSDGIRDVVVAAQHQAWLLSLSGQDGKRLWFRDLLADKEQGAGHSAILHVPTVVGDINGDTVDDLLVVWGRTASQQLSQDAPKRCLEVVSGRDGNTLWSVLLDPTWFETPKGRSVPMAFRWFPRRDATSTVGGSDTKARRAGMIFRSKRGTHETHGWFVWKPDAPRVAQVPAVPSHGDGTICIVAGTHVIAIHATSGDVVFAEDVGCWPCQPALWRDMDGDAVDDVVLVEQLSPESYRCVVWSPNQRGVLWSHDFNAAVAPRASARDSGGVWPLAVDLNGDRACELILPADTSTLVHQPRVPWGVLEVRNGADGELLWSRQLLAMDQQIDCFTVGPDLDDDGWRDIFSAALWGQRFELYVEAMSGADGRAFWWSRQELPPAPSGSIDYVLGPLRWWSTGPDGWPQLLAQAFPDNGVGQQKVCALSAGTGQLTGVMQDAHRVTPVDMDGDGTKDLLRYRAYDPVAQRAAELDVIHHVVEPWRRLGGRRWSALPDVDQDGIRDLVSQAPQATLQVYSGGSGDLLWERQGDNFDTFHLPEPESSSQEHLGDLSGDGVPDLLTWQRTGASSRRTAPFTAVSGKDGTILWKADIQTNVTEHGCLLQTQDLEQDGIPEVIVVAAMDWGYARRMRVSTADQQMWLAVLDGRQGNVRWKLPLSRAYGPSASNGNPPYQFSDLVVEASYADLNGDGTLDVVVPAESPDAPELWAVDGRTGEPLWKLKLPRNGDANPFKNRSRCTPVDLDDDGRQELLVMAYEETTGDRGQRLRWHHLMAVNGDGDVRWRWKASTPRIFDWYHDEPLDRRGPIVFANAAQEPLVALPFTVEATVSRNELVVLDAQGQPVVRRDVGSSMGFRVWSVKHPARQTNLAVLTNVQRLWAVDLDNPQESRWTRELGGRDPAVDARVIGLGMQADSPPVLHLRFGSGDNRLEGIDAWTGATTWTCRGPTPRNRHGWIHVDTIAVLDQTREVPSRIFFQHGHVAQSRQASLPRISPRRGVAKVALTRAQPSLRVASNDPRLLRQLPWNHGIDELVEAAATYWIWASFYCLTLVLLPAAALWAISWRRQWGLRTLVFLPVAAAIFLVGYGTNGPQPIVLNTWQKIIIGVGFVPILISLASYACWLVTRQWRAVRWWTLTAGIVTVTLAATALVLSNTGSGAWLPGERYSLDGWYWIVVAGVYMTGWMMVPSVPFTLRSIR